MTWYYFKIKNDWTIPRVGHEREDYGTWQIGFCEIGGCILVGFFDHIIEKNNRVRNMLQNIDILWASVIFELGKEKQNLYGAKLSDEENNIMVEIGPLEQSVDSILNEFGRWGRNPDDVADWILFTNEGRLNEKWYKNLIDNNSLIGAKLDRLIDFVKTEPRILFWALDGHLYGIFRKNSVTDILRKLEPLAQDIKLSISKHQELLMD